MTTTPDEKSTAVPRRPYWYRLDENDRPYPCEATDMNDNDRRIIDQTWVTNKILVSTVFLGLDHNFLGEGEPILFETMIFGGVHSDYQSRTPDVTLAKVEHALAVAYVKKSIRHRMKKRKHKTFTGSPTEGPFQAFAMMSDRVNRLIAGKDAA